MDYPTDTGFEGEPEAVESETATDETPATNGERQPCLCGCGQVPARKRSKFMPGHDAQLKSRLYRVLKDGDASQYDKDEAAARLEELGWPQPAGA